MQNNLSRLKSYDDDYEIFIKQDKSLKPCNFFEQSTCIASHRNEYDEQDFSAECLPACSHSTIHQEGTSVRNREKNIFLLFLIIKYSRMDEEQVQYVQRIIMEKRRKNMSNIGKTEKNSMARTNKHFWFSSSKLVFP